MEDLNASILNVYWCMFHKPCPEEEGGCKYDDMTWSKRDRDYDIITWESAQNKAGCTIVEYNETNPLERDNPACDMLGAAGFISERCNDAQYDEYGDVEMNYWDE